MNCVANWLDGGISDLWEISERVSHIRQLVSAIVLRNAASISHHQVFLTPPAIPFPVNQYKLHIPDYIYHTSRIVFKILPSLVAPALM